MTLMWTPLRFRFNMDYIAKLKGSFMWKVSFGSYSSSKFLSAFFEFCIVNLSLSSDKILAQVHLNLARKGHLARKLGIFWF